ncbi:hypothetical protein JG687_00007325 [Phytophthora cactorum]|uniref:P-loop containing nucleoside triphosphate hydrolase n=1 Tax=Phytophthora cactorum TaxID=29920 RepID=A0A8T1UKM0_9STRA|nr:hypothetical protein JG687_00007325 [Phytophthora cactorum]
MDTHYVGAPPTPNARPRSSDDGVKRSKKLRLAERYAQEEPFRHRVNPLQHASLPSVISAHWLQPLVSLGAQKVLEKEDIWPVAPQDSCDVLHERFRCHYAPANKELFNLPHVAMAFLKTFRGEIMTIIANYCVYMAAMVLQPFIAKAILQYLDDEENVFHIDNGYVLVALMVGVSFVGITCLNYGFFLSSRVGANMRAIAMDIVYRKALGLSCIARQAYTTGEITTLMSVDSERIFFAIINGPWILVAPLAFLVTAVLVGVLFDGVSAVCGAALLVIVLYTSMQLADHIGDVQKELLSIAEERVKVTSEALQGIRVMKFYAWEESLANRVEKIRAAEIKHYRKFHYLQITNTILLFLTPVFLGGLVMGIYVAMKGTVTVTDAYTIINVVNITRLAVNMFPLAVASLSQASVTYRRTISVRNAHFRWSPEPRIAPDVVIIDPDNSDAVADEQVHLAQVHDISLEGVNLEIDAGSLVMVVGMVGSGKSSLLNALLGINLSGGQKARVAIARAVYHSNYDILVLDDPLSAVDPHVAHAIFSRCIMGLAREKTRLLVLNSHYDLLKHADKIIVLQDGRIAGDGTYTDILAQFPELHSLGDTLDKLEQDVIDEHEDDEKTTTSAPPATAIPAKKGHTLVPEHSKVGGNATGLISSEDRVKGRVSGQTYKSYFDETGFNGILVVFTIVAAYFAGQAMRVVVDWWQGHWANEMENASSSDLSYSELSFVELNKEAVDDNTSFYFTYWAAGRWLAIRLDWLSVVVIFVVTIYLVTSKGQTDSVVAGISLSYSLMLTSMIQWVVRAVDLTDNAMTSVERLLHFRNIVVETDNADCVPINGAAWPARGAIRFDNLCLRYRPDLPLVLRGVSMDIQPGEKVGICGRTGAGKSSLMIALFRICAFDSGSIVIDDIDIEKVRLHDLRRGLAIIPQDPVLYSGSLRDNLDPFGDYTDEAIWSVLQQVHLAAAVTKWGTGLDFVVSERGDNLSVGQRQLLCIGRALLKDSRIVVLDEATANVDTATDRLIQATIQETFAGKTVLIIAHRINTILHCNKIAVMDAGRVAEFGSPSSLLQQPDSIFASLANRSGHH